MASKSDELTEIFNQIWDDAHYDRFDEFDKGINQVKKLMWSVITEVFLKDNPSDLIQHKLEVLKKKIEAL